MYAICIESSHKRGMGHLYRALNIADYLRDINEKFVIIINDDKKSLEILKQKKYPFYVINSYNSNENWETNVVDKFSVEVWINDRMETSIQHVINLRKRKIIIVSIDDHGSGGECSDINFLSMCFTKENDKKKRRYYGLEYLILNKDIEKYRRVRYSLNKVLVTLGGSDTYGVTKNIVSLLKKMDLTADILIGPSFNHKDELSNLSHKFKVYSSVDSLISFFNNYDLAITGGGVTPFEANASGLPCIIIANELHEIENGKYLESLGGSIFAGYHKEIKTECINFSNLNIKYMSQCGIKSIKTNGVDNVFNIIKELRENG